MSEADIADITEKIASGTISAVDGSKQIADLINSKKLQYKVSPKGAISFYGLRKMPITLYLEELEKIRQVSGESEFQEFLKVNDRLLSKKHM